MENSNIWLINHKATLSDDSPLNMDGSEWIKGICVLNATDENSALASFRTYLEKNLMEEIEVYEVKPYAQQDYSDHENAKHITHAVRVTQDRGEIAYIGLMTSEGEEDE